MEDENDYVLTIEQIIEAETNQHIPNGGSPINVSVIPNYMGINLCSVDCIEWGELPDGQLTYVTIQFKPEIH